MEKKNDPKKAFRKTTVEMTGEAEVLVINSRLMMRIFEAAVACSVLHDEIVEAHCNSYIRPMDETESTEGLTKHVSTLSCFLHDLLLELGGGECLDLFPHIAAKD